MDRIEGNVSKWPQIVMRVFFANDCEWAQMVENGQNWSNMVKTMEKLSKIVKDDEKMIGNGTKTMKNDRKW